MEKLKKQINESFFNPILYFLPLLVFIIGNNFWGLELAWKISFPVAIVLLFYVYQFYNRLFLWYVFIAESYVITALIYSLAQSINILSPHIYYADDLLFVFLMLLLLFNKNNIQRIANKRFITKTPMKNNLDELFRITSTLLFVVLFYSILFILFQYKIIHIKYLSIEILQLLYVLTVVLVAIYEIIRVSMIRSLLMKEDWIPILSENGKIVGCEQRLQNVFNQRKYKHPVVRMHIMEEGKILLQKNHSNNSNLWDAPISDYVRMGETIEKTLFKKVKKIYGNIPKKISFLSNYSRENNYEFEYVFLFISCKSVGLPLLNNELIQTKWWTPKQIKENFESGIFTEEFKHEYKILERGGLIFSQHCVCDCELKEIFRPQKVFKIAPQISLQNT